MPKTVVIIAIRIHVITIIIINFHDCIKFIAIALMAFVSLLIPDNICYARIHITAAINTFLIFETEFSLKLKKDYMYIIYIIYIV